MTDWVEEYEESILGEEALNKFLNDLRAYDETLYTMFQEAKNRSRFTVQISEHQLPLIRDFFKAYPLHQEFSGYFEFKEVHPVAIARLEELKNWRRLVCGLVFQVDQYPDLVEKLHQDNFNSLTEEDIAVIKDVCDEYPHFKRRFDRTLGLCI